MAFISAESQQLDFVGDREIPQGVTKQYQVAIWKDSAKTIPEPFEDFYDFEIEFSRAGSEYTSPLTATLVQTYDPDDSTSTQTLKQSCIVIDVDPDISADLTAYDYQYRLYPVFQEGDSTTRYATTLLHGTVEIVKTFSKVRKY